MHSLHSKISPRRPLVSLDANVQKGYSDFMNTTWTPRPISEGTIPTLRQPVFLGAYDAKGGRENCRKHAQYLSRNDRAILFGRGGEEVGTDYTYGLGARHGQKRIILSPLVTEGIEAFSYADRLAELWGLNEYGWYAAFHTDTPHPHFHIIAETQGHNGEKVALTAEVARTWKLHAQALSTSILGLYRPRMSDGFKQWEREYA